GERANLIVITASTDDDWLKPLAHLVWRGILPTVILMDPASFGATRNMRSMDSLLTETGLPHQIVNGDLLKRPDARPGSRGRWEWRFSPTGRAIPVHAPDDLAWKRIR